MSLDCFRSVYGAMHGCVAALATFQSSGGSPYSTIEGFADCGLTVVTTTSSFGKQLSVYDHGSGGLVGRRLYSDIARAASRTRTVRPPACDLAQRHHSSAVTVLTKRT